MPLYLTQLTHYLPALGLWKGHFSVQIDSLPELNAEAQSVMESKGFCRA